MSRNEETRKLAAENLQLKQMLKKATRENSQLKRDLEEYQKIYDETIYVQNRRLRHIRHSLPSDSMDALDKRIKRIWKYRGNVQPLPEENKKESVTYTEEQKDVIHSLEFVRNELKGSRDRKAIKFVNTRMNEWKNPPIVKEQVEVRKRRRLSQEEREMVFILHSKHGIAKNHLGRIFGVHPTTITSIIQKMKDEMPTCSGGWMMGGKKCSTI